MFGLIASCASALRVFAAGDAALRNVRQLGLEIGLGEGEIRRQQIMRNLLAVERLLGDPEGEGRNARRDRGGPGRVSPAS